jgi:hypothetical protein
VHCLTNDLGGDVRASELTVDKPQLARHGWIMLQLILRALRLAQFEARMLRRAPRGRAFPSQQGPWERGTVDTNFVVERVTIRHVTSATDMSRNANTASTLSSELLMNRRDTVRHGGVGVHDFLCKVPPFAYLYICAHARTRLQTMLASLCHLTQTLGRCSQKWQFNPLQERVHHKDGDEQYDPTCAQADQFQRRHPTARLEQQ